MRSAYIRKIWKLIKRKLLSNITFIFNKRIYRYFGRNSLIYKPQKITNKNRICIGNNVFFDKDLRMEAICIKDKQLFSPKLIIEDYVHAEQRCQIFCANYLRIGKNTVLSSDIFITDVVHSYNDIYTNVLRQDLISGETIIGEFCFIGTGVKIIKPVKIGNHVIVGANSVITNDIPPYCVVAGNPGKIIKTYNFKTKKWEKRL